MGNMRLPYASAQPSSAPHPSAAAPAQGGMTDLALDVGNDQRASGRKGAVRSSQRTWWAVFEAKFMLSWSFSEEAAAEKYMPQLQHNMWVVAARSAVLSVITGGGKWVCGPHV
jgi:hypothetical protein